MPSSNIQGCDGISFLDPPPGIRPLLLTLLRGKIVTATAFALSENFHFCLRCARASENGQRPEEQDNPRAVVYRFENYTLDIERRELRSGEEPRHIEPQVFDLLHFLIENRERVVTRDDIFRAVWRGRIVSDAVLSTRINAVRKAIGDDGMRQRLVRTVHGRGFRFVGALLPDIGAVASLELNKSPPAIPSIGSATAFDVPLVPAAWAEPVTEVCTALGYERAALYSMMNAPDKFTQDALKLKVREASIRYWSE
jgi:DNA-binding winged helix-turn-helix (wHTH) protein